MSKIKRYDLLWPLEPYGQPGMYERENGRWVLDEEARDHWMLYRDKLIADILDLRKEVALVRTVEEAVAKIDGLLRRQYEIPSSPRLDLSPETEAMVKDIKEQMAALTPEQAQKLWELNKKCLREIERKKGGPDGDV